MACTCFPKKPAASKPHAAYAVYTSCQGSGRGSIRVRSSRFLLKQGMPCSGQRTLYITLDANRSVSTSCMCGKRVDGVMAAPGDALCVPVTMLLMPWTGESSGRVNARAAQGRTSRAPLCSALHAAPVRVCSCAGQDGQGTLCSASHVAPVRVCRLPQRAPARRATHCTRCPACPALRSLDVDTCRLAQQFTTVRMHEDA